MASPSRPTATATNTDLRDYTRELDVPNDALTREIIGVGIEVHRHLGPGLLESIYQRAMQIELDRREIPYLAQAPVPMTYKGAAVGDFYADLIIAGRVIVELKAVSELAEKALAGDAHAYAQIVNGKFDIKDDEGKSHSFGAYNGDKGYGGRVEAQIAQAEKDLPKKETE